MKSLRSDAAAASSGAVCGAVAVFI
jgi:hypothetical protein